MSTVGVLTVDLTLNNRQFNQNLNNALQQLQRFQQMAQNIGNAISNMSSYMNTFSTSTQNASNNLQQLGSQANSLQNSIGGLGGRIGGMNNGLTLAQQNFNNANSRLINFRNNVNGLSQSIAGVLATIGFGKVTSEVITLASDTNESLNKVDVAFKGNAETIKKWSDTTLESYGIAKGTALDMASLYGDMATSMGINTEKAAEMSKTIVGLAGDLASFKNIGIGQAKTALNSIFTGETESMKMLGVVMTEANLQQYAYTQGINKKIQAMSQEEKVMLRYNYVLASTKNAQGDFARTSDGYANQARMFSESLKELGQRIGETILPVVNTVVKALNKIIGVLKDAPGIVKGFIGAMLLIGTITVPLLAVSGIVATLILNFRTLTASIATATGATGANTAVNLINAQSFFGMGTAIQAVIVRLRALATAQTFSAFGAELKAITLSIRTGMVGALATMKTSIIGVGNALKAFIFTPLGAILALVGAVTWSFKVFYGAYKEKQAIDEQEIKNLKMKKELQDGLLDSSKIEKYAEDEQQLLDILNQMDEVSGKIQEKEARRGTTQQDAKGFGFLTFSTRNFGDIRDLQKLEDKLEEMGYTEDLAREKIRMLTEARKKEKEAIENQQRALQGLTDAEMDELNKGVQKYQDLADNTQPILDNIEAYKALSSMKKRTKEDDDELAKATNYLSLILDKSQVKYDENGKAIGFVDGALSGLKNQIEQTRQQAQQGITIEIKHNFDTVAKALKEAQIALSGLQNQKSNFQNPLYNNPFGAGLGIKSNQNYSYLDSMVDEETEKIKGLQETYAKLADMLNNAGNGSSYKPSKSSSSTSGTKPKTAEQLMQEEVQMSLDVYNYKKQMGQLTIEQEISVLETIRNKTWANTKERMNLDVMLYEKRKELSKKAVDDEIKALEHRNSMGEISEQQLYDSLKAIRTKYTKWYSSNLDEQWQMDERLYQMRKELEQQRLDEFQEKLTDAYDTEEETLKKRKQLYDEQYKNDVRRIEVERDTKVKVLKDTIDQMNRAAEKEDREKQIANAKRLLKQYEQSMTEAGQARAEELRRIIRDQGNAEIKSQLDLQIDTETGKAQEELDRRKRQYDNDMELLDQQDKALDAVYKNMQDKTKNFSSNLIPLFNENIAELQKVLEDNALKELDLKVKATDKIYSALQIATEKGLKPVLDVINGLVGFGNINLSNINTNPNPQLAVAGASNYNNSISLNVEKMEVRSDDDINKIAQAIYNLTTSRRRY